MAKFTDNFTFALVMQNKDICRKFIEMILPEEDFGEVILRPSANPFYDEETDDLKADISEITGIRLCWWEPRPRWWSALVGKP